VPSFGNGNGVGDADVSSTISGKTKTLLLVVLNGGKGGKMVGDANFCYGIHGEDTPWG